MLVEYKKVYEQYADSLGKWKYLSTSQLCLKYLEYRDCDSIKADQYLSGVICRTISKCINYYINQRAKVVTEEDCYDIVIQSVLYVLDKKVWENISSGLFHNKDAPEIAINTRLKTQLINGFVANNRQKRKANAVILSLDSLEEESSDGYFLSYCEDDLENSMFLKKLIKSYFDKEEYLNAYILDLIISEEGFTKNKLNPRFFKGKLKTSVLNIDKRYCETFSETYGLNLHKVESTLEYLHKLTPSMIDKNINNLFRSLRRSKDFSLLLHNAY